MNKADFLGKLSKVKGLLYQKLFNINDTEQKVALGFGIGVFTGILPGAGPLAALFLAVLFKVNRASALIGSILTNTWLSLVTFLLAIKIGSVIFRVSWQGLRSEWAFIAKNPAGKDLFTMPVLKVALPVITGYFVISLCLGGISYLIALIALKNRRAAWRTGITGSPYPWRKRI
ncbi:MAG: DUF2062 domain-containing protein [Candidatus Omnitrophota bacterium]